MISYFLQAVVAFSLSAFVSCTNTDKPVADDTQVEVIDNKQDTTNRKNMQTTIYDFSFRTLDGKEIKLSDYKGKKIMIVNTASECGYTPQYEQLEELYKKHKNKLVIIGFPTNDFGGQEPGTNEEIEQFCQKNYGVTFPIAEKITVKGEETPALYKWLTSKELNGKMDSDIKWNFQKYLLDENGNLIGLYESKIKPNSEEIIREIEK